MREEFEVWAKKSGMNIGTCSGVDEYSYQSTESAWKGWQAAIGSVVVEINSNRKFFSKAEIFQKLSDAGIKCK